MSSPQIARMLGRSASAISSLLSHNKLARQDDPKPLRLLENLSSPEPGGTVEAGALVPESAAGRPVHPVRMMRRRAGAMDAGSGGLDRRGPGSDVPGSPRIEVGMSKAAPERREPSPVGS